MYKFKLCIIKTKICYIIQELISEIAYLFIYYGEHVLELTLKYFSNSFSNHF